MRRIDLYINGQLADLGTSAVVLNYLAEESENPSVVRNTFSLPLVLPSTPNNDRIFTGVHRADYRYTAGRYNPMERVPFVLLTSSAEVIEEGYVKLDTIHQTAATKEYRITLYGGLGTFLYNLAYDAQGNKRTLASLDYGTDLTFRINRDTVRTAWRTLAGQDTDARFQIINFAPCYNGQPEGSFDAGKAFCPTDAYGVTDSVQDGGKTYTARQGNVLCSLAGKYDEWATGDLRSYMQRPVISMRKVVEAIGDPQNNGGYTVAVDSAFFKDTNPYWRDTWLTLGMLDSMQLPAEKGSETTTMPQADVRTTGGGNSTVQSAATLNNGRKGVGTRYTMQVSVRPTIELDTTRVAGSYSLAHEYVSGGSREAQRNLIFYQLLAYDADGNVIGGSKVEVVSSPMNNASRYPSSITAADALRLTGFTPLWSEGDPLAMAGGMHLGLFSAVTSDIGTWTGGSIELSCEADNVSRVALYVRSTGLYSDSTFSVRGSGTAWLENASSSTAAGTQMHWVHTSLSQQTAAYETNGQVHSDTIITQDALLGGTPSPADVLLSFCKTFGLRMEWDNARRVVHIMPRNTYYDGQVIDLSGKVLAERTMTPHTMDARWYEWAGEAAKGAWADAYRSKYGMEYGKKRVNTGYPFNADTKQVLQGYAFRSAAQVLARGRYFYRITEGGKQCPAPFVDGGTYVLWAQDNATKQLNVQTPTDAATVEAVNQTWKGYDYHAAARMQFCDATGKRTEGAHVLCLYRGGLTTGYYSRYTLTDDSSLMVLRNDNTPCWQLGANLLFPDYAVGADLPLPLFGRAAQTLTELTLQMEFGTPQEIDQPGLTVREGSDIYTQFWAAYIADVYDRDARKVEVDVDLRDLQVDTRLLHHFYAFADALWVLTRIRDYNPASDEPVRCEFVRVKDADNYTNGQIM